MQALYLRALKFGGYMKTVQDYLDLGLVLSDGDKLSSAVEDGWIYGKAESHLPLKYHGVVSFAWRDNEGVKPEYEGDKEIELRNGKVKLTSSLNSDDNEDWSILCASSDIVKWRPVVLQSESPTESPKEGKTMKPSEADQSCREPKAIFSTESTMFGDRLRRAAEVFESGDLDISISDGKPVYTEEMHAKGELPPVGIKVKVCIEEAGFYVDEQDAKFEGKTVTVKAAFSNTESEKIVAVENEDGNCYCYIIECIKPIIKTIKVNGFDIPAPMSEAPEGGSEYFVIDILSDDLVSSIEWEGDFKDNQWLSRGIAHSTESAAIAHAKAMLGINPNPTRSGDGYDRNVLGQNNEGDEI